MRRVRYGFVLLQDICRDFTCIRKHEDVELIRPPRLEPGARVALVAPSGPLRGEAELARAIANVRSFAWEPVVADHALARTGYFAGADDERLIDLQRALDDDSIDAIWCLRGGYGSMRLLDRLDFAALVRRPKALLGFSDITALHCAAQCVAGVISYHGPTARAELTEFSRRSLTAALIDGSEPCGHARGALRVRGGSARGRLAGGNLALLAALAGTPYAPELSGAILVLEDVNEAVYRIDRMLQQLRLSGMLRGVRGLAFGAFTEAPEDAGDGARRLDDVILETADLLRVPCVSGIPVGHIDDQWTLPLGVQAELDADARSLICDV
jgi:muramoyltetrapeptide carboxypeptidase